jgi:hypothetical protein
MLEIYLGHIIDLRPWQQIILFKLQNTSFAMANSLTSAFLRREIGKLRDKTKFSENQNHKTPPTRVHVCNMHAHEAQPVRDACL